MGYLTANDQPGQHAPSWYAETAAPWPDHPPLEGEVQADICVVGGGYAGLSAALHLAERGYAVRLLEAHRIGWGASGRNGGQLGIGPRQDIREYEARVGPADARKVWEISIEANGLVRELIARHGIACDLADGYLEAAWRPSDAVDLEAYAAHLHKVYDHSAVSPVGKAEMAEIIGTDRYHGGYHDRMGGHLHPLNYALGLGRAAVAAGAVIHERSVVTGVHPGRVETAGGAVSSPHILLACNGYLDGLVPRSARRMLPLNNFILATEAMGDDRVARVNRHNICVCDTRFVLNYFRLSPDGRMLWGGGESTGRVFPRDLRRVVRTRMLEIYPDLADLEVTHVWGGTLAITASRMPLFQDLGQGMLAIGGWSGSGIHMATMGGKIAAEAIAGQAEQWDVLAAMPVPAFPGGDWFRMPLMRLAMAWYGLRDRL
jgi:gamma-glutamylputrescine oxidase